MYKPKTHVGKVWLDIEPKQRPGISPQDREDVLIRIDGAILLLNGTLKDLHPGVSTAPARQVLARIPVLRARLEGDANATRQDLDSTGKLLDELAQARNELVTQHKERVVADLKLQIRDFRKSLAAATVNASSWSQLDRAFAEYLQTDEPRRASFAEEMLDGIIAQAELQQSIAETHDKRLGWAADELDAHRGVVDEGKLRQLIARAKPGKVSDTAGPLGMATAHFDGSAYPAVDVVPASGGFTLKPTQAKETAAHVCTIQPIGNLLVGRIDQVHEELSEVIVKAAGGSGSFTYPIEGAKKAWEGKWFRRGITPETYKDIEKRELEHLVDFSYAFDLATGTLAKAVNRIAGQTFDSPQGPIHALVEELARGPGVVLIPSRPHDAPGAWAERLPEVLLPLCGFSTERDTRPPKTHSPIEYRPEPTGDSVVIRPVFGEYSLQTKDIIRLEDVPAVYGSASDDEDVRDTPRPERKTRDAPARQARPRPDVTKGAWLTVTSRVLDLEVCAAVDADQEDDGMLQAGSKIRIESAPLQDPATDPNAKVWASTHHKELACLPVAGGQTTAYFRIDVALLE